MADSSEPKAPSKGGENTLALIGSLAGIAGKLVFGPDFDADLGAPFKAGANMIKQNREEQSLLDLLRSTPHTAALADHIPALIQAGGIAKNPDILSHPETAQFFGGQPVGDMLNIPMPNTPAPTMGQGGLLSAIQSPATTQDTIDPTSDAFLRKAAALRPDIAEKLLLHKATKEPNQLKDILQTLLLGKQIEGFESPAQKRASESEQRAFDRSETDRLISSRQEQNQNRANALQKSKITAKEEEGFNDVDTLRTQYQNMLVDLESGIKPDVGKEAIATLIPGGERIMQSADPQFATFRKNVQQSLVQYQKAISGVAISEPEAKRLRPTQPQAGDDPAVFKATAENNLKKANELYLIKAKNTSKRGGDVSQYIDPEVLTKYQAVNEAMNYNLKEALKNPVVQALRKELGIDYSATNVGGK